MDLNYNPPQPVFFGRNELQERRRKSSNSNSNSNNEYVVSKTPSFVRVDDDTEEEMQASSKRSACIVSSRKASLPTSGREVVLAASSRPYLAPAVHAFEDDTHTAELDEEDIEDLWNHDNNHFERGSTTASLEVGAVSMNGRDHTTSTAKLLAKSKEGERKSASSYLPHDDYDAPEALSVIAELATDTHELEKERDQLKRQLSMERRQRAEGIVAASAVVRLASTKDLSSPNEYDSNDTEVEPSKKKKCLLYSLACLFVVVAGAVIGVVIATPPVDPVAPPTTSPSDEENFFSLTGLPIDGEEQYALFGQDTSINQDGTRLVVADTVGAHLYTLQDDGTGQLDWIKTNGDTIVPVNCGELANDDDEASIAIRSNVVVDLSRNGKYVAIGCPFADSYDYTNETFVQGAGKVELYQEVDDGSWEIVGTPIYGSVANAHFGASVSLSGNGGQLAIGTPGSNGGVTVWAINQGEWIQFGDTIKAETLLLSVSTVSLSSDGNILAMSGSPLPGGDAVVEIYGLVLGAWAPMGDGIEGQLQDTSYICDLSGNGQVVAVSNYYVGDGVGPAQDELNDALDVRTFAWSESQQAWMPMGENVHASAPGEKSGYFISMSDDGKLMGMGDPGRRTDAGDITGHAHVYYYDGSEWIPLGPNEFGDGAGDQFGFSVALSSSGNALLVSAPFSRSKGFEHGRVVVYDIDVSIFLDDN